MTRLPTLCALFCIPLLLAACASVHPDDVEARGAGPAVLNGTDAGRAPNVVIDYETTAWHDGKQSPFHRMKTELRVAYDPDTGEVMNARVGSSEGGKAFRHVCLSPSGPVLHVRMVTLLDGRPDDLTVLKLHTDESDAEACRRVGIGPGDGLVESFDILFRKDGTYRILPDTKAYLAGADLRVERRISEGSADGTDMVTARYP